MSGTVDHYLIKTSAYKGAEEIVEGQEQETEEFAEVRNELGQLYNRYCALQKKINKVCPTFEDYVYQCMKNGLFHQIVVAHKSRNHELLDHELLDHDPDQPRRRESDPDSKRMTEQERRNARDKKYQNRDPFESGSSAEEIASNPYIVHTAGKTLDVLDHIDEEIHRTHQYQLQVIIATKKLPWEKDSPWTERRCEPYWPVHYAVEMYNRTLQWQNENPRTQADWTVELCRRLHGLISPIFAQDINDWDLVCWQVATVREGHVKIHSLDNRYEVIFTFTSNAQVKLFYTGPVEMARCDVE